MGFFEDIFGDIGLEESRNHTSSDIAPYYVYLMQNKYNDILSIYKVPYNQSGDGGWRLKDFIADNINDEAKSPVLPEYKFRCYYVAQGAALPEVRRDNLDTFAKLLDNQQLGILEKEISLKDAVYAKSCGQPYFHPDGTAFSGRQYSPKGWDEFIEKDNRKCIIAKFEDLKSSIGEIEIGKVEALNEMNQLIHTASQYQGLVPRLYGSLQDSGWNKEKQKTAALLQKWLFPAFFVTNFGRHKWTDKDMLKFIAQTGINVIRHSANHPAMREFFERQGLADTIDRYQQNKAYMQLDIFHNNGVGEERGFAEEAGQKIVEELKHQCAWFLTESARNNTPQQTAKPISQPSLTTNDPRPGFRSWEEQNQSPSLPENKLEHLSFTPVIKY